MSKRKLFRTNLYPYQIGARVNNREHFPGELALTWKVLTSELFLQTLLYDLRIHAFVMMPNHFHLLITTPEGDIDKAMKEFLSSSTRIMNTANRRCGRVFGARYHWSSVQNATYYAHALKYIYRNPVKAGLAEGVEGYAFSTFAGIAGNAPLPFPVRPPFGDLDHFVKEMRHDQLEAWLNQPHRAEEQEAIRKGFRRRVFKLPLDRRSRQPLEIEASL